MALCVVVVVVVVGGGVVVVAWEMLVSPLCCVVTIARLAVVLP